MADILLTSEVFVKEATNISDNLAGKFLMPSIREAQEQGLKRIIGYGLLARLKALVASKEIFTEDYAAYKELLDNTQYFLAYSTVVEVLFKVAFKINNAGVNRTPDENVQSVSADEVDKMRVYYQGKADACAYDLQSWILNNINAFPELRDCDCNRMRGNLRSAASCGIFLGGARGKIIR